MGAEALPKSAVPRSVWSDEFAAGVAQSSTAPRAIPPIAFVRPRDDAAAAAPGPAAEDVGWVCAGTALESEQDAVYWATQFARAEEASHAANAQARARFDAAAPTSVAAGAKSRLWELSGRCLVGMWPGKDLIQIISATGRGGGQEKSAPPRATQDTTAQVTAAGRANPRHSS